MERLFAIIGRHFRGEALHPGEEVLKQIDICLDLFVFHATTPCRRMTLALTDLRRSLFPDAAPYVPSGGTEPSLSGIAA